MSCSRDGQREFFHPNLEIDRIIRKGQLNLLRRRQMPREIPRGMNCSGVRGRIGPLFAARYHRIEGTNGKRDASFPDIRRRGNFDRAFLAEFSEIFVNFRLARELGNRGTARG